MNSSQLIKSLVEKYGDVAFQTKTEGVGMEAGKMIVARRGIFPLNGGDMLSRNEFMENVIPLEELL